MREPLTETQHTSIPATAFAPFPESYGPWKYLGFILVGCGGFGWEDYVFPNGTRDLSGFAFDGGRRWGWPIVVSQVDRQLHFTDRSTANARPALLAALGITSVRNITCNEETKILLLEVDSPHELSRLNPDFSAHGYFPRVASSLFGRRIDFAVRSASRPKWSWDLNGRAFQRSPITVARPTWSDFDQRPERTYC